MGILLDLLAQSVPNAPGAGLGPVAAGAGTAASGAGAGPAMCPSNDPGDGPDDDPGPDTDPDPDLQDNDPDLNDGQDHTPDGTYTPRYQALSWDAVMEDVDYREGSTSAEPTDSGAGDSFLFPESGVRSYYMIRFLDSYGDWMNEGDGAWGRTGRALTGIIVLPPAAILTCAENQIRSPLL